MSLADREIGRLIRKAREHLKLSVESVAEELGISPDRLLQFELGDGRPAPYQLIALCAVLRVQPSWFFPEILDSNENSDDASLKVTGDGVANLAGKPPRATVMRSEEQIEVSFPGDIVVLLGRDFDELVFQKIVAILRSR